MARKCGRGRYVVFWGKKGLYCPRYSQQGMLSTYKGVNYFLGHALYLHLSPAPKPPINSLFTLIFSSIWYFSRLKIVCGLTNQTLKIAVSAISSLNFLKLLPNRCTDSRYNALDTCTRCRPMCSMRSAGRAKVQHPGGQARGIFSLRRVFSFFFPPKKLISASHLLFYSIFLHRHARNSFKGRAYLQYMSGLKNNLSS